jgi:hypothetical protein
MVIGKNLIFHFQHNYFYNFPLHQLFEEKSRKTYFNFISVPLTKNNRIV